MNIRQTTIGTTAVLSVQGVIKLRESGRVLSERLQKILEMGEGSVLIDLSEVDEVDSTGLGELVGHLQQFSRQGRHLAVVKPTERVRRLFEFMNLHKVLPIFDDLDHALSAVTHS